MRTIPLQPGAVIINQLSGFSPDKHIPFSANVQHAVNRVVLEEHTEVLKPTFGGVALKCTQGTMQQLAEEMSLEWCITINDTMHNRGER